MQARMIVAVAALGLWSCTTGMPGATTTPATSNEFVPVHRTYDPTAPSEEDKKKAIAEAKARESEKKKAQAEKAKKDAEEKEKIAAEEAKAAKAKEAHDQAVIEEAPNLGMAVKICFSKPEVCKKGCEKDGDHMLCFGWARWLTTEKPPKFAEAKAAFAKSCEGSVVTACDEVASIDQEEKKYTAEVDGLWLDVERAGDSIAEKRYLHMFATTKLPQTPKNVKAAANVQLHIKAIIAEQFCPARKAFTSKVSLAEYQVRAKDHCKTNAPVGTGLGGSPVTLTTECNAAFATTCP